MNRPILKTGCGLALLSLLAIPACSGGRAGDRANRGPFQVSLISTGLGQVFPYRIRQADFQGNPTTTILNIDDVEVLKNNSSSANVVLPVGTFGTSATLPNGSPGNQFLLIRFTHRLKAESILSNLLANQSNSGLTTAISVIEYNPGNESTQVVNGRGFVGGYTYYNNGGQLQLVQAVKDDGGAISILDSRANGFPSGFSGDTDLVANNSFVFIPDADGDLAQFETFATNRLIRVIVSNAVRDTEDHVLADEVCTATTVGPDPNPPDVLGAIAGSALQITPGGGATGVDPTSSVLVRFNKPVQPSDVGVFFDATNLIPSTGGITLSVTAGASNFGVIYYADPLGYGDLCNYVVRPAYNFPGSPPAPTPPTSVQVAVNRSSVRGLDGQNLGSTVSTTFTTGAGPGIVNAPVAPEVIYVGIGGVQPGLSVIDLNGFGQGTGDVNNTNFPSNPNIGLPNVSPTLTAGTSNVDAGGAGVFTLTQDSVGNTRLLRDPIVGQVTDVHIGHPLDLVFNNENVNLNSNKTNQLNPLTARNVVGNSITISPHPNPPRLVFPPPNPARAIFGEEPTQTSATGPPGSVLVAPPCIFSPLNLLNVGNPFSKVKGVLGIFGATMPGVFYGPQPQPGSPPPPLSICPFTSRQQIGHFLYVLDRDNRQILVLNSNRMTVLDTIRLTDPVDMAMSPYMTTLAVTEFSSSSVTFIDINPLSSTFHTVIGQTRVDPGPTCVAWQPDGEVVMVANTPSNTVNILSALDFSVQRRLSGFLNAPIDVVLTPRYQLTGNLSGVYYGYILNTDGTIAIYESGPDGVNGTGFNDIIGTVPGISFRRARRMILDTSSNLGALYIGHVDDNNLGQVSRLELTSSPTLPQPINQFQGGFIIPPTFRQKAWTVVQTYGGSNPTTPVQSLLSGNAPVDLATDDIVNAGALPDQTTPFNSGLPAPPTQHSGKGALKIFNGAPVVPKSPKFLFVALADVGRVDVLEIATGNKIATIDVPGVSVVGSYWRQ